jgi:hypothetical protein
MLLAYKNWIWSKDFSHMLTNSSGVGKISRLVSESLKKQNKKTLQHQVKRKAGKKSLPI